LQIYPSITWHDWTFSSAKNTLKRTYGHFQFQFFSGYTHGPSAVVGDDGWKGEGRAARAHNLRSLGPRNVLTTSKLVLQIIWHSRYLNPGHAGSSQRVEPRGQAGKEQ